MGQKVGMTGMVFGLAMLILYTISPEVVETQGVISAALIALIGSGLWYFGGKK